MSNTFPEYPNALVTLNDAMRYASSRETYEIRKAHLYGGGVDGREIYLVALRGTDQSWDKNDVLGIPVCLRSFLAKPNIYFNKVKNAILTEVPEGASLVLVGHSLGGMILEQISADREINLKYSLVNLLTIGSPYVKVKSRICPFRRVADTFDFIPWLGFSVKANLISERPVYKNNGYFGNPLGAHTDSYRESDSWREYDCFGILNGGHAVVF